MRISADFTTIPDAYAKNAPAESRVDGTPVVSFPFYVDQVHEQAQYLHWAFTDPDSIPVCGFEWIHWTVANLPIAALMYDFNDSHALQIPPDFSRTMTAMIPEALQGNNSCAGGFLRRTKIEIARRYNGPQPPNEDHDYHLQVWATSEPLTNLAQGFWLNHMMKSLNSVRGVVDYGGLVLTGRC